MRATWGFKRRGGRVVRVGVDPRWEPGRFGRQGGVRQRLRQEQIAVELAMGELKSMYQRLLIEEGNSIIRALRSQQPFIVNGVFHIGEWVAWQQARSDAEKARLLAEFKARHAQGQGNQHAGSVGADQSE